MSAATNLDVRIAHWVTALLRDHPETRGAQIAVEVQNGVVLLSGTVNSSDVRRWAGDLARLAAGTRDVCNMLSSFHPAESPEHSGPRLWAAVMAGVSVTWWLLVIVVMTMGWLGAVIGCLVAVGALEAFRLVRSRGR